jgi:hypothetical protein
VAAPEYVPVPATEDPRLPWTSPEYALWQWKADRPAELQGRQPQGHRMGYQGPDQGYALRLAEHFRDKLRPQPHEHAADAVAGCLGIALRRASMFGRAPTVHDLTVAFTIWGWLDPSPPSELVVRRRERFAEVGHAGHEPERRLIADTVPEATLRQPHGDVLASYPGRWQELLGF